VSRERHRIFDAHTHIYPDCAGGFWRRPSSVDALIAAMDDAGVAKAAVIAIAPHIPTETVCKAVAAHADRLVPIGSVDPHGSDALAEIDRAVQHLGVRAIKLHPRLQGIRFEDLDTLIPIANHCAKAGVPLIVCSFCGGRELFRSRTLELCHELAASSPETALVMAHAGGHRPLDALMVLKANDNVHVDLSFSPLYFANSSVQADLEFLVRKADPGRVLFGSDFPEVPLQASVAWLVELSGRLALSPGHLQAMLHDNAARLFKFASWESPE
jgi:predicted TIM-barrel fold metal-dependent hydrolase